MGFQRDFLAILPMAIALLIATQRRPWYSSRVQPLDWDGGALHGMLLAKAITATPYICDFQLYHHVSTPYIQGLRRDFLADLEQAMPAFIIDMHEKIGV